jgi:hypothetical protein
MLLNANVHIIDEGCSHPPQEKKKSSQCKFKCHHLKFTQKNPNNQIRSLGSDYSTNLNPKQPIKGNGLRRKYIDLLIKDLPRTNQNWGLNELWWVDLFHTTSYSI